MEKISFNSFSNFKKHQPFLVFVLLAVMPLLTQAAVTGDPCCIIDPTAPISSVLPDGSTNLDVLVNTQTIPNSVEISAARAIQSTFLTLLAIGCDELQTQDTELCNGQVLQLFDNLRAIVHTANEINGAVPTIFSLGLNSAELNEALRWNAGEEYASQASLSSNFLGGQLSGMQNRMSGLRQGDTGFTLNQNGHGQDVANHPYGLYGGGASADVNAGSYSRLGGFLNFGYGEGSRDPSDLEDAFDFDASEITLGLDYRLDNNWIIGGVFGYSQQELEFDPSKSVVDGSIEADGWSFLPFAMYQRGNWYASGSVGWQQLKFDSTRAIRYPSFNFQQAGINTETQSSTDATITSLFLEFGYSFQIRKFLLEPFVNLDFTETTIDEFVEQDLNNSAFDLVVQEQEITSREYSLGAKFQYTLTPSFGVFIPYLSLAQVLQTEDESRIINSYYAQSPSSEVTFFVPTEVLDDNYTVINIGVSSVLRGARQRKAGGRVGGDIQGFINYKTLLNLQDYAVDFFEIGLRYTF